MKPKQQRNSNRGTIRRSQIITTYGVGSVVAVEDESFMVTGIDRWPVSSPDLHEPRLERELSVQGFTTPPASEAGNDIPVVRFPNWGWCPSCHTLNEHRFFCSFDQNKCNTCGVPLVPSRFVIACQKGHIDDFPFFNWVHKFSTPTGQRHNMRIEAGGTTASLRDIRISCDCGCAPVTMEGAFIKTALKGIARCRGRRPWLSGQNDDCDEIPRTLQRGASNVWFPVVRSAISIPPWSEGAFKLLNRFWVALRSVPEEAIHETIRGMQLTKGTEFSIEDLVVAVKQRKNRESPESVDDHSLKFQEYEALVKGRAELTSRQDFVCVPADSSDENLVPWFDKIMLVKRLREVRVLESFTRLLPPGPADRPDQRAPLYDSSPGWLPAVEVIGEGVFFRLNTDRLESWEARSEVKERAQRINKNYLRRFQEVGAVSDRLISPRLVLIHTLAHALINQWALDSGYPAGSLRERLYVSDEMAGFLIYTATTDSAGSLGGVIAQAAPGRISVALTEALERFSWCSADPVCIEAEAQGVESLNLAACHACALLPEVSCEEMNLLLDRGFLIGIPENPQLGFFESLTH